MESVRNKAVVVTGAGRGLGRAYAHALAAAGARIVVNDCDGDCASAVADEITARGGVARASGHSIILDGAAEALIADCCDHFGGIDGLINNAGLYTFGPADAIDLAEAHALFEVNVFGLLRCGLAAIRRMTPERRGTIINVTSGAALGMAERSVYGASKAAVNAITANWALEWAPRATILGLSPVGQTRMTRSQYGDQPLSPPPEDAAPAAVYLMSEEARALHGRTLRIAMGRIGLLEPAQFIGLAGEGPWTAQGIAAAVATHIGGAG